MPLSIERAGLVRHLAAHGYPDDQIAGLLKIRRDTVTGIRQRAARDAAIRVEAQHGKALKDIAEQFDVTLSTAKHVAKWR